MLVDYISPLVCFYNDARVKKTLRNCAQAIVKTDI